MANIYKNAFYDPTTTAAETVYTVPSNARAIVQNIQLTNESGSKVAKVSVTDSSATRLSNCICRYYWSNHLQCCKRACSS